jgi:hypothetical protein
MSKSINHTKAENENENEENIEDALESFETRWKYAVFPAMIAFVILAGFGFYLIYGMLQRMEELSVNIDQMAKVMTKSLPIMEVGVVGMSSQMQSIGNDLHGMRADMSQLSNVVSDTMPAMEGKVGTMSNNIYDMRNATASMANTTHNMGQNLWNMNRNFSKPLSMMRKIMPWGGDNTPPPRLNTSLYNTQMLTIPKPSQQTIKPTLPPETNVLIPAPMTLIPNTK